MTRNANTKTTTNAKATISAIAGVVVFPRRCLAAVMVLIALCGCTDTSTESDRSGEDRPVNTDTTTADVDESTAQEGRLQAESDTFVDVAQSAGIDFTHFNGMSGKYYVAEEKGPGCGLFDYDNDGDLDVYLIQGAMLGENVTFEDATFPPKGPLPPKDRLYRNDLTVGPDGKKTLKFTDVTAESGIEATGYGYGVAAGDYDNDGFVDIYVSGYGPNYMFRNNGDGTFTDVTERTGTGDDRYNTSASFVDYDHDGNLDLYVCAYVNFSYAHPSCHSLTGKLVWCGPLSYKAIPDRLYRNRGDGTFEDVTVAARILPDELGSGLGIVCADFNGDGWIDLYIANDARPNHLWINQGDGTFVDEALLAGCALNHAGMSEASMGVDAGDFDADGDEDLFMTHLAEQSNTIYVNDGTGLFTDLSRETGLAAPSMPYTSFGTSWVDYDNDSLLDIFIANGEVLPIEEQVRQGDPLPLKQPNQLFRNHGDGKLVEVTESAGKVFDLVEVSRGAAFGDIDNDGDTDILVANNSGRPRLLINQIGNRNHWIGLKLVDTEKKRDMLGTWVGIYRGDGPTLWRRVRAAASFCATNDPRLLVGLGDGTDITKVTAKWPDGSVEEWAAPPVDKYTTLLKGSGKNIIKPADNRGKQGE